MTFKNFFKIIFIDGISLVRKSSLHDLNLAFRWRGLKDILLNVEKHEYEKIISLINHSESQFLQDLFVASKLSFKKNGYFVEFGATDGKKFSNTYMLEKKLGWSGVLSEPSRQYHSKLNFFRNAKIDHRCVTNESNKFIQFKEFEGTGISKAGNLSIFDSFISFFKNIKKNTYSVKTVSLTDLLAEHGAPKKIDYLSIDVEGSEYSILKSFRWDIYSFNVITVEHNFTEQREKIYQLLTKNGYIRVHKDISYVDDWYILDANSN